MDSLKNQHAPILIVYPRPHSKSGIQEDFCSFEFRDAPLLVYRRCGNPVDEEDDNGSLYTPITFPLLWCNYKDTRDKWCMFCDSKIVNTSGYYSTYGEFDKRIFTNFRSRQFLFHIECIKPMENNPYHPKHSLQILMFTNTAYTVSNTKVCYCCYQVANYKGRFYYCSICNFSICNVCATKPLLLTIDHKKRHEHTLSYIPREASMTCDVCAMDNRRYFIYFCHQCDFVVHKECIYSPSIIKISRHEHRLSFTYSLRHGNWFCGVCHKKYDENYGGYSCVKGCGYVVHSRCATEGYLWDKKELEGVPENAYEDITPFKVISDGIIQHFSHSHHMRLYQEIDKLREESICCQVCALRIYDGDVFSCMECDFVLHKACAYLPLKKDHPTHLHPLVLKQVNEKPFMCPACHRACNSFAYVCKDNDYDCFVLDVHCALISEPLDHHFHPHLLYLPYKTDAKICSICKRNIKESYPHLDCEECGFVMCFSCANLPKKFVYKHDEHPLIFSYEQDVSDQYWCDVCEEEAYPKNGVYMCNDCNVTLHVECLFGREMFMLPGKIIPGYGETFLNNRLTRNVCARCHKRCHQNKVFYGSLSNNEIYCSVLCLVDYNYSLSP